MNLVQGAPNPKRTTQLQHSSAGGKNKACIILCCLDHQHIPDDQYQWITKLEYNICIVDLKSDIVGIVDDEDGFTLVSPTFQIECGVSEENPIKDAFCVLGQTLYMFEGSSYNEEPHASRKSVFALDLTRTQTLTQRTTKLAKDGPLLKKIGDMTFPKPSPAALPTPEGDKIVVFSEHKHTFELFEPANRSWEQLPSITRHEQAHYSIWAYGFLQDSYKLVVQTDYCGGLYALDLASSSDDRHWVKLGTIYSGVERLPRGCHAFFETVQESRFCIVNSCGFYDLEEYVGEYGHDDVCLSSVFGPYGRGGRCYAARLSYGGDENKGECDFCHMVIGGPSSSSDRTTTQQTCRATIDVCRVDLKSYKEMADQLSLYDLRWSDELKQSKTTIVKTLNFSLGFEGTRKLYEPHLFFTF